MKERRFATLRGTTLPHAPKKSATNACAKCGSRTCPHAPHKPHAVAARAKPTRNVVSPADLWRELLPSRPPDPPEPFEVGASAAAPLPEPDALLTPWQPSRYGCAYAPDPPQEVFRARV